MISMFLFEVLVTVSIAMVMSLNGCVVYLSGLYSSKDIEKRQLFNSLPTPLILFAFVITVFFPFNPQGNNLANPLSCSWELISTSELIFIFKFR